MNLKIALRVFLVLFIFLAVFHNINIFLMYELPGPSEDSRLSSLVLTNEINSGLRYDLYDRIENKAVISEFVSIFEKHFKGKVFALNDTLISRYAMEHEGFRTEHVAIKELPAELEKEFLGSAFKTVWYNPIIFSGRGYTKTGRYPLQTKPEFSREYPIMILFIKDDENKIENVETYICGRYLIFITEGIKTRIIRGLQK